MPVQLLGILLQAAGLAILFRHWRAKGGLGGAVLAGAWVLIVLGAAPWLLTVAWERALALGVLAPMVLGLALLAPDALPRLTSGKVRRERPVRAEPANEAGFPATGRAGRNAARWVGALVAAPAMSAAGCAVALAYGPWSPIDTMVISAFLFAALLTGALLWLLAATRPWRADAICTGAALVLAALAAAGAH